MRIDFHAANDSVITSVNSPAVATSKEWVPFTKTVRIPPEAVKARFRLISSYKAGQRNNDGYFDDLFFGVLERE